ncbi:hypothetical protein B0T18DRAFT_188035 [Schizothecium vesticola]|uniref:RNA polymerase II degradation factor 1 n=1 Tax=Schizothecium vesticola TaxID=314040 RepID=A0AA40EQH3_9PEZI|nr:hypothetical protein B0T18DRAFT_188035 [Schizothecium vesticola]
MSEVQTRPAATRGRGSGRGGRGGGLSTRGGSRLASQNGAPNGDAKHDTDSSLPTLEDEGEVGQLKKLYGTKVDLIKEIVPDWSEVDILFALRETDGDESLAVTRIAEGTIAQWGEVSKPKKERVRAKGKTDGFPTSSPDAAGLRPARGGRPIDSGRGRGRATERGGRGGARGKPVAATNGTRAKETSQLSVPTEDAHDWGNNTTTTDDWDTPAAAPAAAAPVAPKPVPAPANAPKTWASMLRQSTVPKAAPKPKEAPAAEPAEPTSESLPAAESETVESEPAPAPVEEEVTPDEPVEEAPAPATEVPTVVVPEVTLPPSKDQLTETNLEQITDTSHPAPEGTARSEAADSWDPRAQAPSATATPLSASQQQHQLSRVPASGFAATATKATERAATRTPSHTRRILEQREAVRMPGNRGEVDHAAVQFGAFSLNGPVDDDTEGGPEEPETRVQPPEDSPIAHPRTALPTVVPTSIPETFPAQKPAVSLPPTGPAGMHYLPITTSLAAAATDYPQFAAAVAPQTIPTAPSQVVQPPTAPSAQQYGRFGQAAPQELSSFQSQKPFDSFGQQQASTTAAQSQFEGGFPSQAQPGLPPTQPPAGAFSSAPGEYSSFYTADQSRTAPYNQYYNQAYNQQGAAQGQQDSLSSQTGRSFSGYNAPQSDPLSQYPQSGGQQHQSRFGAAAAGAEAPAGANPTANPVGSQAQAGQAAQGQTHGQQPHDFQYGSHPYSYSPYYSGYMNNQAGYNYSSYGPYGKGGHGYQPNQYGGVQAPHGYGSSPAAGFSQTALHRDTPAGAAGLGDYSRAGTTQSAQQQGLAGSGFGGMHDAFGRGASTYQSQAGQGFNAPGAQPGSGPSAADDLKPFGDAKATGGPSPSLGAAARPGSAANNGPSQSGLPPPQSAAYGYPSHVQGQHGLHGNPAGGSGYGMSASGAQGHQNTGYGGGYGAQGFGNYYGNAPRGGWGNNYH